jgi:hypothetical protein
MRIDRAWFVSVVILLFISLARGTQPPNEIPFTLVRNFAIVVQGGIGPLSNLNFLLDTGAAPSVVGKRIASQLGAGGNRGTFALLDKELEAQYVTVTDVRLGPIRAANLSVVVVDLTRFEKSLGLRIDAVIGLDLLAGEDFTIDYKRQKIIRGLSGTAFHVVDAEIRIAAGAPYWILPISLGGHTYHVLLDTGADHLALFSGYPQTTESTSPALRPLAIREALSDSQPVILPRPPSALQDIDGVLGPAALGITRIGFDWEHRWLRWNMGE